MDIDGLGESIITLLLKQDLIKDISDLYYLKKEQISVLERMGDKSATNLINAINKSKENDLWRFINGLGIKLIGTKAAKILASEFKDLDKLMNATEQELINLEEFGQTMADSVVEFFKEEKNISVIEKLKEAGVNTKLIESDDADIPKIFEKMKNKSAESLDIILEYYSLNSVEKSVINNYRNIVMISQYPNVCMYIRNLKKYPDKVVELIELIVGQNI